MLAGVELDGVLGDVVFLAITVAFFGLTWLVVRMCDRIAGTADAATYRVPASVDEERVVEDAPPEPAAALR